LGEAYKVDGNLKQAIVMLQRAVNGRSGLDPMPTNLVIESAESLAQAHRLDQGFAEAAGCSKWISKVLRPATASEQVSLPSPETGDIAFAWCKEQGFNVDAHDFTFDVSDSAMGTSPLHRAIKLEKLDVFQQMIGQVGSFEHRDTDFATPLLLAASTCRYGMTRLLLERGAKVDVCDHSNKTPLHRCQAKVGGVKVARLLLETQPDLVNRVDGAKRTALFMAVENGNFEMAELLLGTFGAKPDVQETYERTALFRACELGNEAMVGLLLKYDANPNIRGPGMCTPLLAAIDVAVRTEHRVAIAGMLRNRGADPYLRDADDQNAFDMAGKAGYASELRRLLHTQEPRRMSTSSARSRVSRASGSSTGKLSSRALNFLKGY
jgi:ankyrin repeat protein